jgi:tetratricopeptide (TPR) repeat protein
MERPTKPTVGRPTEALNTVRLLAEFSERLATENPHDHDDLSGALIEFVNTCKDPEKRDDALQLGSRVLKITEGLAAQNRHEFEPIQARTLNILGSLYAVLDRPEEALRMAQRGAEIRGRLAKQNPGVFEPELAMSLSNLGVRYSEAGIPKEAVKATARAVEIFERLPME